MTSAEPAAEQPIVVAVPNTEQHVRDAHEAVLSRSWLRVFPYYLWAGCFYSLVMFISLLSPKRLVTLQNLEYLVLLIFLFLASLAWLPAWRARRSRPDDILAGTPSVWTFTRSRVAYRIGEYASSDFDWRIIHAVENLPRGLLLFTQRHVVHWIPKTAFASAEDYGRLAEWAAYGAPRYRQRREWKLAEWIASLLLAPLVVPLALHFAALFQSGEGVLESYLTLSQMLGLGLPFAYLGSWIPGAPVYWLIGRFTRNLVAFPAAGAAIGAIVGFAMSAIGLLGIGTPAWVAGFAAAAIVHWVIVVRGS